VKEIWFPCKQQEWNLMKDGKFEGLNYKYLEEDFEVSEGEIEIERVGRPQK